MHESGANLLRNIKHRVLEPDPNYLSSYAPFSIEAQGVSFAVRTDCPLHKHGANDFSYDQPFATIIIFFCIC